MAALRPQTLRHLTSRQGCQLRSRQRRWARVHDVRFVATQQTRDRILDKYRHKLDQKAKEQGLNDINELKEAYKDKITHLRKTGAITGITSPLQPPPQKSSAPVSPWPIPPPPPSQPEGPLDQVTPTSPNYKSPGVKTLSSFLDIPKTLTLPKREIESIWRLRHAYSSHSLCAFMSATAYASMASTARKHPQFILPGLPSTDEQTDSASSKTGGGGGGGGALDGAPIHFLQWTFPSRDTATVLFTHLAEYKLRGEFAQPHTTFTHHLELADAKGLVLCQGSVVEGRGVTAEEGRWLILCLQKFYNRQSAEDGDADGGSSSVGKEMQKRRRRLMEQFSQGDSSFRVEELLEEAERLG